MTVRIASCRCGALSAECRGAPLRVSVCHCLECQKRTGGVFSAQARWADENVTLRGDASVYEFVGSSRRMALFRFCPACGSTISFVIEAMPGVTAIPIGAFADPNFPPPAFSVYENRKHAWVAIIGDNVEHD